MTPRLAGLAGSVGAEDEDEATLVGTEAATVGTGVFTDGAAEIEGAAAVAPGRSQGFGGEGIVWVVVVENDDERCLQEPMRADLASAPCNRW